MAYTPRIYLPEAKPGEKRTPDPPLAHYLTRVLRLGSGATLAVFDGQGHEFEARLAGTRRTPVVCIGTIARSEPAPRPAIELWVGVSRHTRMEWTLEKTVELGVSLIRPVLCAHSKVRLDDERGARKFSHWQALVNAATAQSGRAWQPTLARPRPLREMWQDTPDGTCLLLDPQGEITLSSLAPKHERLALLVGPESGFSAEEYRAARHAGWQVIRLGPRVLRAETAGPAALAAIQALWGDWRPESQKTSDAD